MINKVIILLAISIAAVGLVDNLYCSDFDGDGTDDVGVFRPFT